VVGAAPLLQGNHTLKRALTDPTLFSGIGNAYSDEILHAARLSPLALTQRLDDEAIARLHTAARQTLQHWSERLREEAGEDFPDETNYCARCQTGGRLLADRALSRLLKADWPRFVDGFDQE